MNNNQQLLFARVGFSTRVLTMLSEYSEDIDTSKLNKKELNKLSRRMRRWASGENTPKNPFYNLLANELDLHLSQRAMQILVNHNSDKLILTKYNNDDDFWSKTDDFPLPHEIHTALLQRICILNTLAEKPITIELVPHVNDDELMSSEHNMEHLQDWDSYINLDIGLDMDVSVLSQFAVSDDDGIRH